MSRGVEVIGDGLEDQALAAPLLSALPTLGVCQGCACGVLEDFSDAFTSLGAAFDILDGADALSDFLALEYVLEYLYFRWSARSCSAAEGNVLARLSLASVMSCAAPQSSSDRTASPSCNQRG